MMEVKPKRRPTNQQQDRSPRRGPPRHTTHPNKVLVTCYPAYSQVPDFHRAFSKFGPVNVETLTKKFATLNFETTESARAAINASKKINIYGDFVVVKPCTDTRLAEWDRHSPRKNFKQKPKSLIIEPKELDLSGDISEQLERLLAAVRLTQEEVSAISGVYSDVEKTLQKLWPGCIAIPFGSITTGLGVKSSDADCFVMLPPQLRRSRDNHVNRTKHLLEQYPEIFNEVVSIPRAHTPIVKFYHIPTDTHCDLTFKTPLGAQNSKLIAFLLHADPRLIPMAVFIKYWAKVHDLSGTGKLTNYALTMLIIFYLQQPPLSILPSVEWLQRDSSNDILVDEWNTGIMNDTKNLPQCMNTSSVHELIGGFFEFYSLFNFEEMMVCPYLGRPVKKELFADINLVPPEFQRYKSNVIKNNVLPIRFASQICVQDPFEQCHNVASAITTRLAAALKAFFKFAANAYEKEKLNKCEKFLPIILLQKPKIIRTKTHPEFRVNIYPRSIETIIDSDWRPVVRDIVLTIFENMLKLQIGKVEEKMNPDSKKQKEKYMGYITKAVWKRKQFSRIYAVMDLDFIEKQQKITEEIMQVDKEVFNIQFQLTLTFCLEPRSAVVSVKLGTGDIGGFNDFGKFFLYAMNTWFTVLLVPHARTTDKDTASETAETMRLNDSNEVDSEDEVQLPIVVTNSKNGIQET